MCAKIGAEMGLIEDKHTFVSQYDAWKKRARDFCREQRPGMPLRMLPDVSYPFLEEGARTVSDMRVSISRVIRYLDDRTTPHSFRKWGLACLYAYMSESKPSVLAALYADPEHRRLLGAVLEKLEGVCASAFQTGCGNTYKVEDIAMFDIIDQGLDAVVCLAKASASESKKYKVRRGLDVPGCSDVFQRVVSAEQTAQALRDAKDIADEDYRRLIAGLCLGLLATVTPDY